MGFSAEISIESPWQNPYCERVIGSIKKDCVNHLVVLNEDHLKRKLSEYIKYYHGDRTHISLDKDSPLGRAVQEKPETGKVIALSRVGGLHHRYEWRKAA